MQFSSLLTIGGGGETKYYEMSSYLLEDRKKNKTVPEICMELHSVKCKLRAQFNVSKPEILRSILL